MPELPGLIQALLDPRAYPDPTGKVELRQTQMSYVFLTDNYAYKIKRPVNFGFLDYTTLGKRRLYCRKEVELNRRLCPDAYLGVVRVTHNNGRTAIGGKGKAAEYAVKMRRLPQEAMMDVRLAADKVTPEMITRVAAVLARFHEKSATDDAISAFGGIDAVTRNAEENFSQTGKYIGVTLSPDTYQRIRAYTRGFLEANTALFQKRVAGGRIRDCHGDLHAAHICFGDNGICIYDCIEFNDRFRYCDVASEVAFLAMDLDHYGRADLSNGFIDAYVAKSGDAELKKLLNFYKCYRAYVRGKVGSFQSDDPYISAGEKEKALAAARSYFKLAESYIADDKGCNRLGEPLAEFIETELKPRFLLIACGLPATGKTAITAEIARIKGGQLLRSDLIRRELLKDEDIFEEKVAASMEKRALVYEEMFRQADEALGKSDSVILDATFITQSLRRQAARLAAKHKVTLVILQTVCPGDVAIRRILGRSRETYQSNAVTEQAYFNNERQFEAVDLDGLKKLHPGLNIVHLVVDTRHDRLEDWYIAGVEKR